MIVLDTNNQLYLDNSKLMHTPTGFTFILVSQNTGYTSSNGTTWTISQNLCFTHYGSITFSGGVWLIPVGTGTISRSVDNGVTWSNHDIDTFNMGISTKICSIDDKFYLGDYYDSSKTVTCIKSSDNGYDWNNNYICETGYSITSWLSGSNKIIASPKYSGLSLYGFVYNEENLGWQEVIKTETGITSSVLLYGNSMWVLINTASPRKVWYNLDIKNQNGWVNSYNYDGGYDMRPIDSCYDNGRFIVVGGINTPTIISSEDGINWTRSNVSLVDPLGYCKPIRCYSVCYNDGYYYITYYCYNQTGGGSYPTQNRIDRSTDGVNWVFVSNPPKLGSPQKMRTGTIWNTF